MKNTDIHIRISKKIYEALKTLAQKEYRSVSAIVNRAIENHLKSKKVEV